MRVVYSLIWILSIATQTVVAQEVRNDVLCMSVYFENGFSSVNRSPDREKLDSLAKRLHAMYVDNRISEITVKGRTSPNGLPENNGRLAEARARNTAEYLAEHAALPYSVFRVEGCGIDWQQLEKEAATSSDLPFREEVLRILGDTSDGAAELRKHRLVHLKAGEPYKYIYTRIFPSLRRADICAVVKGEAILPPPANSAPTAENASRDTSEPTPDTAAEPSAAEETHEAAAPTPARRGRRPLPPVSGSRIALKTNLLYDAALIPNIGLEYRFADRWTLSADYMHAWWSNNGKHRYWRCYGGEVALRRYFGNQAFTGHHIGIYGTMLSYDIELSSRKGYQSDGFNYGAGFEYGYSLPVGGRLNLDFSLGAGYFGGNYKEYIPMDGCYVWQKTENLRWFGPTRAQIALVWILGGERRSTKGGAR